MNKVLLLPVVALATTLVAAAEPVPAPAATQTSSSASRLALLNTEAVGNRKKFAYLERLRKDVAADGLSAQLKSERLHAQFFIEDPTVTAYLTDLVNRLLVSWHGPRPALAIILKSDESACASATAEGEIIICTGMLDRLQSEHAVAAMLSHELSHILLQHSALTMLSNKLDMLVQGTGLTAAAATVYGKPTDEGASDALDTFAGTQVASLLWSDLLRTRNNREEEKTSDQLGTDLTLASGMDSDGWDQFLDIFDDQAGALSARMQLLQQTAKAKIVYDAGQGIAKDDDDALTEVAKLGALNEAQDQAFEWLAELNVDYPPKGVREQSRKDYERETIDGEADPQPWSSGKFDEVLKAGPGRELLNLDKAAFDLGRAIAARDRKRAAELFASLTRNPATMQPRALFVAAQYAYTQKDLAAADGFLARLITLRHAPALAYTSLASLRGKNLEQPRAAVDVLDSGVSALRTKRPFLPLLASMHAKLGDSKKLTEYWTLCGCYSDKSGFSGDDVARQLLGEQKDDLRQQCVKALGHDLDAKAPTDNGTQWNPLNKIGAGFKIIVRRGRCLIDS